jgi:hypothetical protein
MHQRVSEHFAVSKAPSLKLNMNSVIVVMIAVSVVTVNDANLKVNC